MLATAPITGDIIIHDERDPLLHSIEARRYEWHGGDLARVSYSYPWAGVPQGARPGDWLTIGPYRVRVIEDADFAQQYIVSREAAWRSWLRYQAVRHTPMVGLAYRRMILTLAIWRLADVREYTVPSWRDIRLAKRIRVWRASR